MLQNRVAIAREFVEKGLYVRSFDFGKFPLLEMRENPSIEGTFVKDLRGLPVVPKDFCFPFGCELAETHGLLGGKLAPV